MYSKKIFIALCLLFFAFSFDINAQKNYAIKLQTTNNEKLVGQMIMVKNIGYITDNEGVIRLNNISKDEFDKMAEDILLPQYSGKSLKKEYRGNFLYVVIPNRTDLPLNLSSYITELKKQKEELENIIKQKLNRGENNEEVEKEIEKYKQQLNKLEQRLVKKEELLEEQKAIKEKLYQEIDKLGGNAEIFRKESEELGKVAEQIKKQKDLSDSALNESRQNLQTSEIEKNKQQKKAQNNFRALSITIILSVVAFAVFSIILWIILKASRKLKQQKQEIEANRVKIESLLLNILPKDVAEELSLKGTTETKYYEHTTILFADVKGFSSMAKDITPQQLILELDATFGKFDDIVHQHNIERIKTIGDCYMCTGGVPKRNRTNPIDVTLAALEIQKWMADEKAKRNGSFWEIRLGIHSGDLVAGVIGKTKFAFDVWGNSVNTAARMESGGEVGKVNISEATYEYIKDYFMFTPRGKIDAKNIGMIDTYFVDRLKPEYSKDEEGFIPNDIFLEYIKNNF